MTPPGADPRSAGTELPGPRQERRQDARQESAHAWQVPGETAEQLAERGATGALHTADGSVYFEQGAVVHAESPYAPDLARLLTASGRIPAGAWRQTVERYGSERRVGRMLVEQGWLTLGELEICHLGALFDAAYFALGARSRDTRFEPGVLHWLGSVSAVSPRLVRRETVRRRDLLERIWPWPQLDTEPVVRCPDGSRVAARRSPRQRELLAFADGRRTPTDLACLLGRSAFATTVEIRRLAAAGAVATPGCRSLPQAAAPACEARARPAPDAASAARPPLPKRPARSVHPVPAAAGRLSVPGPLSVPDPDIALLTRVKTALEARL